jgi:hypothetical protein
MSDPIAAQLKRNPKNLRTMRNTARALPLDFVAGPYPKPAQRSKAQTAQVVAAEFVAKGRPRLEMTL